MIEANVEPRPADEHYWFARRFPVGDERNSLSPVTAEGWRVVRNYNFALIGGAVGALVLVFFGVTSSWVYFLLAPVVFLGAAGWGGWQLVGQAQLHGDNTHTVDDYKAGRVPGQRPYSK
jgi:hypothetical protein